MKLNFSQYLSRYLANGIDKLHKKGMPMDFNAEGLEPIIQQGIEGFAKTQDVFVDVIDKKNNCYNERYC